MNTPLLFLAMALAVSVLGSAVIAFRHRRPETMHGSIDGFADRMKALAPESEDERGS